MSTLRTRTGASGRAQPRFRQTLARLAWGLLAAGALAGGLSGCASTGDAIGSAPAAEFALLDVDAPSPAGARFSDEARFAQADWTQVEQATRLLARRDVGSFEGEPSGWVRRRVVIHHRSYTLAQESRGAVLLVPGFTEGLTIYQEVVHDLVRSGYSVYIHDHRGQGFSTRLLPGEGGADKGHIDQFDHLVADFERYLAHVQLQRAAEGRAAAPLYVLAHSMGGAVVSLHLARRGTDTPLRAAALVTPMHEPRIAAPGLGEGLERAARRWCDDYSVRLPFQLPWLSTQRVQGRPFDAARAAFEASAAPQDNELSHSVPRMLRRWAARAGQCAPGTAEAPHCGHGDAKVEGPTLRWVAQACAGAREARGPAARATAVPVLLLSGGQDTVVDNAAQRSYCAQVNLGQAGRCTGLQLPGARHGLLAEVDSLRQPALARVVAHFDAAAGQVVLPGAAAAVSAPASSTQRWR